MLHPRNKAETGICGVICTSAWQEGEVREARTFGFWNLGCKAVLAKENVEVGVVGEKDV